MTAADTRIHPLPIDVIRPSPFQPREMFDKDKLDELAESIKENDLIEPIIVRKHGNTYEIVAGERRWRAFGLLKRKEIPAIIRELSDIEAMELSLIENLQREDLTPGEKEKMVKRMWEDGQKAGKYKTRSDLAKVLGYASRTVRTLLISSEVRDVEKLPDTMDTLTVYNVSRVPEKDRPAFKSMLSSGAITLHDHATDEVRVLRKAEEKKAPEISEALLRPVERGQRVFTPDIAERVLEVEDPKTRQVLVQKVEEQRLQVREVEPLVEAAKTLPPVIVNAVLSERITPDAGRQLATVVKDAEKQREIITKYGRDDQISQVVEVMTEASPLVKEMLFDRYIRFTPEHIRIATTYKDDKILARSLELIRQENRRHPLTEEVITEGLIANAKYTEETLAAETRQITEFWEDIFRGVAEERERRVEDRAKWVSSPEGREKLWTTYNWGIHREMMKVLAEWLCLGHPDKWRREAAEASFHCPHCGKVGVENLGWMCCGTPIQEAHDQSKKEWDALEAKRTSEVMEKRRLRQEKGKK